MKQPNRWSCLPTAFAIAMDIPIQRMFDLIGHDGSEIVWPELPEPLRRRAFHITECIATAYRLGYSVTEFEIKPLLAPDDNHVLPIQIAFNFREYLCTRRGVAYGYPRGKMLRHAIAFGWNTAFDPNGTTYSDFQNQFAVERFWLIDFIGQN